MQILDPSFLINNLLRVIFCHCQKVWLW